MEGLQLREKVQKAAAKTLKRIGDIKQFTS